MHSGKLPVPRGIQVETRQQLVKDGTEEIHNLSEWQTFWECHKSYGYFPHKNIQMCKILHTLGYEALLCHVYMAGGHLVGDEFHAWSYRQQYVNWEVFPSFVSSPSLNLVTKHLWKKGVATWHILSGLHDDLFTLFFFNLLNQEL